MISVAKIYIHQYLILCVNIRIKKGQYLGQKGKWRFCRLCLTEFLQHHLHKNIPTNTT